MGRSDVRNIGRIRGPLTDARDSRHGTTQGYFYWGCRCAKCVTQSSAYQREFRKGKVDNARPEDHGTTKLYNYGCRCDKCRAVAHIKSQTPQAREYKRGRKRMENMPKVDLGGLA